MLLKRALLLLLLLFGLNVAEGQQLLPYVENFTKSEYNGDNQVWNVAQGTDKAMYFANNHYFLRYDGVKWEKYTMPNKTIIRSIFIWGNKIYCGSYKEFGYWERLNGVMRYTCLSSEKLFTGFAGNEEIWKIFRNGNRLFFQSFNALYVYEQGRIERLNFPSQISYCYVIKNQVYAATTRNGIYRLMGNKFVHVKEWALVNGSVVHGMDQYNNNTFIFTKNKGVYVANAMGIASWDNALNNVLKEEVILSEQFIGKNLLAIGTSRSGLYLVNLNDGSYKNINRQNSLKNNAVLSITTDREGDLWLGLDNGIAHVEINAPLQLFTDNSGLLGSVYSLSTFSGGYLLVTNHGVFTYSDQNIAPVPNTQGQVWDIYKNGNSFIMGHNDGTYVFSNGMVTKVSPVNGGWKFLKSRYDNVYFQANYSGIAVYNNINNLGKYKILDKIQKPIRNIAQNHPGELWAADNYRSLYRITYDDNFNVKQVENVSANNHIKSDFNVKICSFRDQVLFFIAGSWYTYNAVSTKLEKNQLFNKEFGFISDIIPIDDNNFLVFKNNLLYLVNQNGDSFSWRLIPDKYYQGRLIIENIQVYNQGNKIYINLDDGFLCLNRDLPKETVPTVTVEGFYEGKLIIHGTRIKYGSALELNIVTSHFGFLKPNLVYSLDDGKTYSPVVAGKVLLNNLSSGDYSLVLYTENGRIHTKVGEYNFSVSKAWYYSWYMIVVYIMFTSAVLFLYYRWNTLKYMQKVRLNEEELRHRTQIMELEYQAEMKLKEQQYEKHRLEMEVQSKASEVAGKSLSIAKHSEMIESIQEALDTEKDTPKLVSKIKKIIKTNSISKNEWQSFEKNLVKSHEEFVERLTTKYPLLTPKDIKLCIYLKMNLSSKEIAPLMNISFRGVELHRYRLRKKLGISTEESLTRFMITV